MRRFLLPQLALALFGLATIATAAEQPGSFALRAGKVITISGEEHAPGVVVVRDGRIESVGGEDHAIPEGLELVEAPEGVVMPGFIDAHSSRGLDFTYESTPDSSFIRASDGLNPVSLEIEDARRNGITTLLVAPSNNSFIGGRCPIIHPQGIEVPTMIVQQDAALKISLQPRPGSSRMGHLAQLRRILDGTRRYIDERAEALKRSGKRKHDDEIPPEKKTLVDLLEGNIRAFVYCPTAADVSTAFSLGRNYGFHVTPILAPEAWRAAELVRTNNVRAILTPRLDTWELMPDGTQVHVNLARVLSDAGVPYSLTTDTRELGAQHPWYQAARAVRAGVSREEALAAITHEPAVLLGFGRRKGVLQAGADADLLLLSDDPLSGTAFVDRAWVRGIQIYDRSKDVKLERLMRVGDEPPVMVPESDHGDPKVEGLEHRREAIEREADPLGAEAAMRWPAGPGVTGAPEKHPAPTPAWREDLEGRE